MSKRTVPSWCLASSITALIGVCVIAPVYAVELPAGGSFNRAELKQYSDLRQKLDPSADNLYDQVTLAFPKKDRYSAYEIEAFTSPTTKRERPIPKQAQKNPPPMPGSWRKEKVRAYLDQIDKNRVGDQKLWYALVEKYGDQEWYTREQVHAIEHPPKPVPAKKPKEQKGAVPPGGIQKAAVQNEFAQREAKAALEEPLWNTMTKKYGKQDWYTPQQLRDIIDNGEKIRKVDLPRPDDDLVAPFADHADDRDYYFWRGFRTPRIRETWRDVLYEEDPSQADAKGGKGDVKGDLSGATFSYNVDNHAHTDTWAAVGALIFPWKHAIAAPEGLSTLRDAVPKYLALAPSVTIDRVDTNGDPKNEVDTLFYRVGGFIDWYGSFQSEQDGHFKVLPWGVQLRSALVYATDTGGHGSLPGFEVDLEPRLNLSKHLGIGYRKILIPKFPAKKDESDFAYWDYQLRLWLHLEGGDIQDSGKTWDTVPGSFLRLGPSVELRTTFYDTPLFHNDLSVTLLYTYLDSISGADTRDSYFHATVSYALTSDPNPNHKISLTADYQNGGLTFTKERVDAFTLGLSVLY